MSDTTRSIQKICKVCGRNCSTIPRVKNSHGHYFCKTCHDALAAKAAAGAAAVRRSQSESGDQLSVQEVHDEPPAERPGSDTRVEYAEKREAAERAMWKHEHFKAIGMMIVGLFGSMVAIGVLEDRDGDYLLGEYFIEFGINWVVGIGAFWLCSITFLGVDSPLYLSGLRLGAAYAMSDLAFLATAPFITPLLAFFVMLGCYIGLLMTLFELDLTDAALLAVSLFAVKLVIYFVTAMLIFTAST